MKYEKQKWCRHIFTHRELDKEPFYYPPRINFGCIPCIIGVILGMILGAWIYFSWTWELLTK